LKEGPSLAVASTAAVDAAVVDLAVVDSIVKRIGVEVSQTAPILTAVQDHFNYLPEMALRRICEVSHISPADIESVSSFYSQFRLTPSGRHRIKVCVGTACFVKGADQIYNAFRDALDIGEDADTDADGLFTVEKVACLGCCMLAPAVQIDQRVFGHLTRENVPATIAAFLRAGARDAGARTGDDPVTRARAPRPSSPRGEIRLCTCTSCRASGSEELHAEFRRRVCEERLEVDLKRVGCDGSSYNAPVVELVTSQGASVVHPRVGLDQVDQLLWRHYRAGAARRLVDRLLERTPWADTTTEAPDRSGDRIFLDAQVRIVTAGANRLSPFDLAGYRADGGFAGLESVLREHTPTKVLELLEKSGLRGRGGAGFPTWQKWGEVVAAEGLRKITICNADEGDPGAFMDRMILESFPYRVIEGMAIAAWTVGADEGIIYVRSEYPQAVQTVRRAIHDCEEAGLVGTDRGVRITVLEGAGAFVCGEETALIAALEGKRGSPRWRPPYPSESGLMGMPTLINNVETLATVPWIVNNGAEAFREIGTADSPGTKTFALAGKILRGGLIEIPMGISIRQIVEDIGGGVAGGKELKAVQIGGPSGGCVPASMADLPVDYEQLSGSGTMMGSGGMIVLDDTDCMVDIARYFMEFTQAESCGKCTCCRIGTKRMLEILTRLCAGTARPDDLDQLKSLCRIVKDGSLCGLGQTAPNPVLTTIEYFEDEYRAHVEGRCPAGKCKSLIRYFITDRCIGCTRCAQRCPVDAIPVTPYDRHAIDPETCIRCGTCMQVCPSDAVEIR
jgi:NADH-quinone oxidoreductase subunit F